MPAAVYRFRSFAAVESAAARDEVEQFAVVDLHDQDRRSWVRSYEAALAAGRPAPQRSRLAFDLGYCRRESRRIRIKRERDETHSNQLTNPTP